VTQGRLVGEGVYSNRSCSSARLFSLRLLNQLAVDLDFRTCTGHERSSPGLKVKVRSRGQKAALNFRQFLCVFVLRSLFTR